NAKSLAGLLLTDLPDEAVHVVMEHSCCSDQRCGDANDPIVFEERPRMSQRTKSQTNRHINQHEPDARAKQKTDEGARFGRVTVSAEIEHPHDRQILDVMP